MYGSFWRFEARMLTVIVPLLCPRPLPYGPLPKQDFATTTVCCWEQPSQGHLSGKGDYTDKWRRLSGK
jgi:hypothetical protein